MKSRYKDAFTLVELLVVISIMAILAAILLANMANAAKRGRDAQRQADLRNLQTAIEAYKNKNGVYPPMGCKDANGWSTEKKCPAYITELAPAFISGLPHDSARGANEGYAYMTNNKGTVYKVMAMNTVESDKILYDHPFKSCDIKYGDNGDFPNSVDGGTAGLIDKYGWCSAVWDYANNISGDMPRQCLSVNDKNQNGDPGNGRFDNSYALWGGFADEGKGLASAVRKTTDIICQ